MKERTDHRDTLYTIDKRGRRKWVYAHFLSGKFTRLRRPVAWFLIVFYLALPWITVGGKQAVLLDIPHRRFVFFGLELWATDTIFLFLTLALLAMCLFLFTAILGRVWCGWACPETVFLEFVFRPIERLIEGSDSERRKLDASPWTREKILKKIAKHSLCAAFAWVLANTALAYFVGRENLIFMVTHSPFINPGPFLLTIAVMALMAFQFGWFREQFCTVLCPYARFQSVLMDQNSLLVGYDYRRGEPRGKLRSSNNDTGDCIDCGMCVRVCPTGIDIRNGTQLECVACTACIDACDSIMDKIKKPRGLIRYATELELQGGHTKWIRPRLFVYSLLLAGIIAAFTFFITSRIPFDAEFVRAIHNEPFTIDKGEIVTNQFSLRLTNKSKKSLRFEVRPDDSLSNISIVSPLAQLSISPGESQQVPVFVQSPLKDFKSGARAIIVQVKSSEGEAITREFSLIGPG